VALMIVFAHFFVLAGSDLVWFLEATGFRYSSLLSIVRSSIVTNHLHDRFGST
jgi:hypothetical protein